MSAAAQLPLQVLFWAACGLVLYTYAGYPLLLFLASSAVELRRAWRHLLRDSPGIAPAAVPLPSVSIVIAAHNEEAEIAGLCASLRALDYPRDRLELVLVSDGSTDGTDACFEQLREPWMHLLRQPVHAGKASALNAGAACARHEVLVLLDASTRPQYDSVRRLARHFRHPGVGVVCGALRFRHHAGSSQTEGAYWSYECLLRLMEGRLGATLTASGALYAVRRSCFPRLRPDVWIEDFLIPMQARRAGFAVLYDPDAWAWEVPAPSLGGEFRRRVRLAVGSFRGLGELLRTPLDGVTRWALLSHKLLRWGVPFFLLVTLAGSLALWPLPFYRGLALAQLGVYWLAWAGNRRHKLARGLYFFLAMNAAFLWGFMLFLFDRRETAWQQVR